MYLDSKKRKESIIQKIIEATFPEYKGRKIQVQTRITFVPNNSWEGGSRTDWKIVSRDGRIYNPGDNFSNGIMNSKEAYLPVQIPENCFLVEHIIFQGKDLGIRISVRPEEWDSLQIEKTLELSTEEEIVLVYTGSLKPSYAGIKNYRFYSAKTETGISREKWDSAVESLISKGFLRKNKSITEKGRNAVEGKNQWDF